MKPQRDHRSPLRLALALGLSCVIATSITGCKEKKKAAPPPTTTKRNTPPPPPPTFNVQTVAQTMGVDSRVKVAGDQEVNDESFAQAAAQLASAVASGDESALRSLIRKGDSATLDLLIDTDDWAVETEKIEQVRIITVAEGSVPGVGFSGGFNPNVKLPDGAVLLAVQEPGSSYLLGWAVYNVSGEWKFSGYGTIPDRRDRASQWDTIGDSAFVHVTASAETATTPVGNSFTNPVPDQAPQQQPTQSKPKQRTTPSPAGPITIPGEG